MRLLVLTLTSFVPFVSLFASFALFAAHTENAEVFSFVLFSNVLIFILCAIGFHNAPRAKRRR
jgi:hypothetical protein